MGPERNQSGDQITRARRLAIEARALCSRSQELLQELRRIRYEVRKQRATFRQYPSLVARLKSVADEHR